MKNILLLICFFGFLKVSATNYYFSTSGDDLLNSGTSSSSPYKTITKLNTLSLSAGDTVFFKCGEIFRGEINLNYSGTSTSKIVFTSYDSGTQPIISGADVVQTWVLNGSIYEAVIAKKTNNFFINNKEQTIARYPNNNRYLSLDSAQKNYLKDASLNSLPSSYISNSWVCVHTAQWCWEKSAVSSYINASNQINYTTPMKLIALNNYGYFLYDNINLLDTATEWKYDSVAGKIYYMPETAINPNTQTCEASVYSNGISINSSASYITISNLQFDKQMNAGVSINSISNHHISITNCTFTRQYNYGLSDKGRDNEVNNSTFLEIDGIGIFVNGGGKNCTIHHNSVRKTGLIRNNGIGTEINGSSIKMGFSDSNYVHHNNIDSAGYCGVSADGKYNLVEKNVISNVMLCNNDGGALKSFGGASQYNIFQNNFIITSDGNTDGTYQPNFITPAIYFDFNVNNCIIRNNVVYNRTQKGIFQNAGDSSNIIENNIIYGGNISLDLNGASTQPTAIKNMTIKKNIFWAKNTFDYLFRQVDVYNSYNYGNIDSNYYYHPYVSKDSILYRLNGFSVKPFSFNNWQTEGKDNNAIINNFKWQPSVDSSQIFTNATDNVVSQNLQGFIWKDLNGNYITSLTLQPWTAAVLIKTNIALPVQFLNYSVELISNKLALNKWNVANETNLSHYQVERSTNGITFEKISELTALQKNEYSFMDTVSNIFESFKKIYYRIAVIDKDGTKSYSTTKTISFINSKDKIVIYPNPVNTYLNIFTENGKELYIYNLAGVILYKQAITSTITSINCYNFSAGNYFIKIVSNNNEVVVEKFIKQ